MFAYLVNRRQEFSRNGDPQEVLHLRAVALASDLDDLFSEEQCLLFVVAILIIGVALTVPWHFL